MSVLACSATEFRVAVALSSKMAARNKKPDQLQAIQHSIGEMQFGVGEFAAWVVFDVGKNLDDHLV